MPTYNLKSDTLTAGSVTRKITAATYPEALLLMDAYVDELDGIHKPLDTDNLPPTLTIDELLSGDYGEFHNYHDNKVTGRWHIILKNGWIYTGKGASPIGRRCGPLQRLDPVYLNQA